MALITDEQFYSNLPPNGLALAKEQAAEYFVQTMLDSDYPAKDAVSQLLLIHQIEQEQQGDTACA